MTKKCVANRVVADLHLMLRGNTFYYIREISSPIGKRKFLRKSLRTTNYYVAKEYVKQIEASRQEKDQAMNLIPSLYRDISSSLHKLSYVRTIDGARFRFPRKNYNQTDAFELQHICHVAEIVVAKRKAELGMSMSEYDVQVIERYNEHYKPIMALSVNEALVQALNQWNEIERERNEIERQKVEALQKLTEEAKTLQQKLSCSGSATLPYIIKEEGEPRTIGMLFESFLKTNGLTDPKEQDNKTRTTVIIKNGIEYVGLTFSSPYRMLHNSTTLNKIYEFYSNETDSRKRADPNAAPKELSGTVKSRHLNLMQKFIEHASTVSVKLGYDKSEILEFCGYTIKRTEKKDMKPHMAYTEQELQTMFSFDHEFFKKHMDVFWACMIALFSGSRNNAIITLHISDIVEKIANGKRVMCFNFQENEPRKHLKTEDSERIIPIHSKLIEMGFLDYVAWRKRISAKETPTKQPYLFPRCAIPTNPSVSYNKFFNGLINSHFKQVKIKQPEKGKYDFHSFRKVANRELAKPEYGIDRDYINLIIGWEDKETRTMSYGAYRKEIPNLQRELEKLRYPYLEEEFNKWGKYIKDTFS